MQRKKSETGIVYKAIMVPQDLHGEIKLVATLNGQTMIEWIEWVTKKGREAVVTARGHVSKA